MTDSLEWSSNSASLFFKWPYKALFLVHFLGRWYYPFTEMQSFHLVGVLFLGKPGNLVVHSGDLGVRVPIGLL